MSLRLLNFVLKLYSFVAISPNSLSFSHTTKWRRIYALLSMAAMIVGVTISLKFRHFYKFHVYIKGALCYLIDLGITIFHIYIVASANFVQTQKWRTLFDNLRFNNLKVSE